jgi:hypothetical protein
MSATLQELPLTSDAAVAILSHAADSNPDYMVMGGYGSSWLTDRRASLDATYEPEHEQDHQNQAENTAESGAAVSAVSIISAASAQQNNHQNDNQNRTHLKPFRQFWIAAFFVALGRGRHKTNQ